MKKKFALFAVFVIISFFGIGYDSFFGKVRSNDPVQSGEMLEYHVNVANHADDDLKGANLKMFIYDLGELIVAPHFDVKSSNSDGKLILWDTTGIPPGEYWTRITLSNDDFREVKHRYITIV